MNPITNLLLNMLYLLMLTHYTFTTSQCLSQPISVSNITSCFGEECQVQLSTVIKLNIGQSIPTCISFIYPDQSTEEIQVKLDIHKTTYQMDFLYLTGDDILTTISNNCYCPDIFSTSIAEPAECPVGRNYFCLKKKYYKPMDNFDDKGPCILGTGDARLSYSYLLKLRENYLIYKVGKPRTALLGTLTTKNSTLPIKWTREKSVVAIGSKGLKIEHVMDNIKETELQNQLLVLDRDEAKEAYLLNKNLFNLIGYNMDKLGWARKTSEQSNWLIDLEKVKESFFVDVPTCSSGDYHSYFNRAIIKDQLTNRNTVSGKTGYDYDITMDSNSYIHFMIQNRHVFKAVAPSFLGDYGEYVTVIDRSDLTMPLVGRKIEPITGCMFKFIKNGIENTNTHLSTMDCVNWDPVGQNYTRIINSDYVIKENPKNSEMCILTQTHTHPETAPITLTDLVDFETWLYAGDRCVLLKMIGGKINIGGTTVKPDINSKLILKTTKEETIELKVTSKGRIKFKSTANHLPEIIRCRKNKNNSLSIHFESSMETDVMITCSNPHLIISGHHNVIKGKSHYELPLVENNIKSEVEFNFCQRMNCKKCDVLLNITENIYEPIKLNVLNTENWKKTIQRWIPHWTTGYNTLDNSLYWFLIGGILFVSFVILVLVVALVKNVYKKIKDTCDCLCFPFMVIWNLIGGNKKQQTKEKTKSKPTSKGKSIKKLMKEEGLEN